MTAYGGGEGQITHVLLSGRRVEAERWILQRGLPRKAVLIATSWDSARGATVPEAAEVVMLPSYERLSPQKRLAIRLSINEAKARSRT